MITNEMICETIESAKGWLYEVENLTDQLVDNDSSLSAVGESLKAIRTYLNGLKSELVAALHVYDDFVAA